jgi:membrane-bound serine protease (ClpP class)
MLGREIRTPEGTERAALTVAASLGLFVLGLIAIVAVLPRTTRFGGLVLQANVDGANSASTAAAAVRQPGGWLRLFGGSEPLAHDRPAAPAARPGAPTDRPLTGRTGTAVTDLRPSGIAEIDGRRVDVVADGEFVRSGEPVAVLRDEGYRRVVRRIAG